MTDAHAQADALVDTRRREFWQTLLALGFDATAACTGAYSGVRLDARVFATGIYHGRASELVLHFLLTHLDTARAQREFADCWPIGGARQARDFRGHVFRWLDELRRAGAEPQDAAASWPGDVPVRRSDVDEGRGLRFEHMLWALASLVARQVLRGPWRRFHGHVGAQDWRGLRELRERYVGRTGDRRRAQDAWRAAQGALAAQLAEVRGRRARAYEDFRASRRRVRSIAEAPPADAAAEEVAAALRRRAERPRDLWRATAGWVDEHGALVEAVESVVGLRANGVRLDGRRHVRVAPAPSMAGEWTRWMDARGVGPFRGDKVDVHVVARMAAACVGALRGALQGDEPGVRLGGGGEPSGPLPRGEGGVVVERSVRAAEARVERLRRLRSRLLAQREEVCCALRALRRAEPSGESSAGRACALVEADSGLPLALPRPRSAPCAPARLADAWAAMLAAPEAANEDADGIPAHAAYPTPGVARVSLVRPAGGRRLVTSSETPLRAKDSTYPDVRPHKRTLLHRFELWMINDGKMYIYLGFWVLLQALLYSLAAVNYSYYPLWQNMHILLGGSFIGARSAALVLHINTALVLLPICRTVISWIRTTPLNRVIPFDHALLFHKLVGYSIILFALVHTGSHYRNYWVVATVTGTPYWRMLFTTGHSITGHIMLFIMIIMGVTGWAKIRRKHFNLFWNLHHLYVIYFACFSIHGGFCLLKSNLPPFCSTGAAFWKYWLFSGVIYLFERLSREFRANVRAKTMKVQKVILHPGKVIEVQFRKPRGFKGLAGQYAFLNCPAVSTQQWHPFTLTSAPEEDYVSVHVRVVGDWTKSFAAALGANDEHWKALEASLGDSDTRGRKAKRPETASKDNRPPRLDAAAAAAATGRDSMAYAPLSARKDNGERRNTALMRNRPNTMLLVDQSGGGNFEDMMAAGAAGGGGSLASRLSQYISGSRRGSMSAKQRTRGSLGAGAFGGQPMDNHNTSNMPTLKQL
ncbi:hypothetical protein GGI15_004404, partial [Coemansia interrupta]